MPFQFAVVCEAEADFRIASRLAERMIENDGSASWLVEQIDHCPIWAECEPGKTYLRWDHLKETAKREGIRVTARDFREESDKRVEDEKAGLRALRYLKSHHPNLDFILLIRDDDRRTWRRAGLEQARNVSPWSNHRVAIGLAHCKREAWILAGFEPAPEESEKVDELRGVLGFQPHREAHRLTASRIDDKLSAKRVLKILTADSPEREAACYEEPPLQTLIERGQENGLADFLAELQNRLIPIIQGRKHPA